MAVCPFPVEPPRDLRGDRPCPCRGSTPLGPVDPPERQAGLSIRQAQVSRVGWAVFNVCQRDLQGAQRPPPHQSRPTPQLPDARRCPAARCHALSRRPPGRPGPVAGAIALVIATAREPRSKEPSAWPAMGSAPRLPRRRRWTLSLPPGFDDGLGRRLRPWVAGTGHRQSTLVKCLHVGAVERVGMGRIKVGGDRR